jgi:hypothetical protein
MLGKLVNVQVFLPGIYIFIVLALILLSFPLPDDTGGSGSSEGFIWLLLLTLPWNLFSVGILFSSEPGWDNEILIPTFLFAAAFNAYLIHLLCKPSVARLNTYKGDKVREFD